MDLRRLRAGEWMLAAGSALLLLSLFTGWYEAKSVLVQFVAPSGDYTLTAFEAFDAIVFRPDIPVVKDFYKALAFVLAAGALLGLALVVASAMQRVTAVSIAGSAVMALIAFGLLVLVLYPTVRIPDFRATRGLFLDSSRDTGIWLALAGCALMFVGSLASMRDQRITGDTRSVDPADIETLPAPLGGPPPKGAAPPATGS